MTYRLLGTNLDNLPKNAAAILSYSNDEPLMFRDDLADNHSYAIKVVSSGEVIATYKSPTANPSLPNYLAAILTEDRSTVLWVNTSKPLP